MIVIEVEDLHVKRLLKILSKLHWPLGECNLTESSNVTSSSILCAVKTLR